MKVFTLETNVNVWMTYKDKKTLVFYGAEQLDVELMLYRFSYDYENMPYRHMVTKHDMVKLYKL